MSVYVGRDVSVRIQVPIKDENVSDQLDGTETQFYVSKTPISDRDMDGVADEPEHVTVTVNGGVVEVSAVDDDVGLVTLASAPGAEDTVLVSYRYDEEPYVAQEFTVSPKQDVEAVDGLGSDVVQLWAATARVFEGSIKEVLKKGSLSQLRRLRPFRFYYEPCNSLEGFVVEEGEASIVDGCLYPSGSYQGVYLKGLVFDDFSYRVRVKVSSGDYEGALAFRVQDLNGFSNCYVFRVYPSGDLVEFVKVEGGSMTVLHQHSVSLEGDAWYEWLVVGVDGKFWFYKDGVFLFSHLDNTYSAGRFGVRSLGGVAYYDDFHLSPPWASEDERFGIIASWSQNGSTVKIGFDGVIFPEASIPSVKNQVVYLTVPFKAESAKLIG